MRGECTLDTLNLVEFGKGAEKSGKTREVEKLRELGYVTVIRSLESRYTCTALAAASSSAIPHSRATSASSSSPPLSLPAKRIRAARKNREKGSLGDGRGACAREKRR